MARTFNFTVVTLGALLVAAGAQAAPANEGRTGTNGPNMPEAKDVVPSEIRPLEPAATGSARERGVLEGRSRWQDIHPNSPAPAPR